MLSTQWMFSYLKVVSNMNVFDFLFRLWSHLIPTFYVSAKELLKQAVVFSCEIVCDSISTPIYEL